MASATSHMTSGPPFPLNELTTAPWREQALTKIGEQRALAGADRGAAARESST